ncbi:MAG: CopG family transcriptional regulator [Spirochaetia bacterium]
MVRTQIQLSEEQALRLKAFAARRGVSMAEIVRQGIEMLLAQGGEKSPTELRQRALAAAGKFRSGLHDVATRHDGYLAGDYAE